MEISLQLRAKVDIFTFGIDDTCTYMFFFSAKTDCTATKVDNSDKSADNSITGKTGDKVLVTCNSDYFGGGEGNIYWISFSMICS